MTDAFPPVATLVPHGGPMCLLEAVLAHDEAETRCAVDPAGSALFADATGRVPAWVALEYMAQCVAVHAQLLAARDGELPRPGLLVGCRRLTLGRAAEADFLPGRRLVVAVRPGPASGRSVSFDCSVRRPDAAAEAPPLAEGRLHVRLLEDEA